MKYSKIILASLLAMVFAGCETEEKLLENHLFIEASSFKNELRVATDEGVSDMSRNIVLGMAAPMENDVNVDFKVSPELVDTYCLAYYEEAELLPENCYNMDGVKAVIKAGSIQSNSVTLDFRQLDKLDYSKVYVLPVSVVTSDVAVLERSKTMYYVVKEASLVNVAADLTDTCAWPEWGDFDEVENMETFTMECLLNIHAFNNKEIETIMGIEDHFLIRLGDALVPKNQIQIATAIYDGSSTYRGGLTNENMQLKADRWYHLAVTFDHGVIRCYIDGKLRGELTNTVIGNRPDETGQIEDVRFETANFKVKHSDETNSQPRCFWIGHSYNGERYLDGMMAEARVWSKVLTQEEINAEGHFYKLYPDAVTGQFPAELLAYWKFCEGEGKTVKDWSIYGHDLTGCTNDVEKEHADKDFLWHQVALPK